jgi:hypothetical protein
VIGFYMDRAGFDEASLKMLLDLGTDFDFYLAHGMGKKVLDKRWRLFHPEHF